MSDEAPLGVALVPGQRPAGETLGGTVNMLCSDRYSDLGAGATYQSTRLEVRRLAESFAPRETSHALEAMSRSSPEVRVGPGAPTG